MSLRSNYRAPSQDRSRYTLQCILEGARQELERVGPQASIRDIAARAGVAPSTITDRFVTRDALLELVHEEDCVRAVRELDQRIAELEAKKLPLDELVLEAINAGLRSTRERAPFILAMNELARKNPAVARRRAERLEQQVERIVACGERAFGTTWHPGAVAIVRRVMHMVITSGLATETYGVLGAFAGAMDASFYGDIALKLFRRDRCASAA